MATRSPLPHMSQEVCVVNLIGRFQMPRCQLCSQDRVWDDIMNNFSLLDIPNGIWNVFDMGISSDLLILPG